MEARPLDAPDSLSGPCPWADRLSRDGTFAAKLVDAVNPRRIVGLGTVDGSAYFYFCRAVAEAGAPVSCIAIPDHVGKGRATADDGQGQALKAANAAYGSFSTVADRPLAEVIADLEDGSVDLLLVAKEFREEKAGAALKGLRAKLSSRAIILFAESAAHYWRGVFAQDQAISFQGPDGLAALFWGAQGADGLARTAHLFARADTRQAEGKGKQVLQSVRDTGGAQASFTLNSDAIARLADNLTKAGIDSEATFEAFMRLRADMAALATIADEAELLRLQRDRAEAEAAELRRLVTRLLRNPFRSIGENVHYKAASGLSQVMAPMSSRTAGRLAQSALKRSPKRFMDPHWYAAPHSELPLYTTGGVEADAARPAPLVVLPFRRRLVADRAPQKIAVFLHAYHADQGALFEGYLRNIPETFDLFVSTDTQEKADHLRDVFARGAARRTEVAVMPNRGRDIAPKLVGYNAAHADYDLVLHLHTKKSPHSSVLSGWRSFILDALIGSGEAVDSILDAFACTPRLGMIAPPNFPRVRPHMRWDENFEDAQTLAARMGVDLTLDAPLDFPSGSMFWARTDALRPLLDIGLTRDDFPEETGQLDGTTAHAIERLFFYSCESAGLRWIHAGPLTILPPMDEPVRIASPSDLDEATSERMPALILPGIRP